MSSTPDLTSRLLRHERRLVAGGVLFLALLCWAWLSTGAGMASVNGMAMATPSFAAIVLMWWLMMGAMMLPAATPAVLLYAQVRRGRSTNAAALPAPWTFLSGYAVIWLAFSIAATLVQVLVAGPDMRVHQPAVVSAVLIAAGVYQLSPVKGACLRHCRSPAHFFTRHWRPGALGAFRLGLLHGSYCVGCCWLLMALLFVGGVMNLAFVALLTALVAAEKLLPAGRLIARVSGFGLVAAGIGLALF